MPSITRDAIFNWGVTMKRLGIIRRGLQLSSSIVHEVVSLFGILIYDGFAWCDKVEKSGPLEVFQIRVDGLIRTRYWL